jgi:hypothetical protein
MVLKLSAATGQTIRYLGRRDHPPAHVRDAATGSRRVSMLVREIVGHSDIEVTMIIYAVTRVVRREAQGARERTQLMPLPPIAPAPTAAVSVSAVQGGPPRVSWRLRLLGELGFMATRKHHSAELRERAVAMVFELHA